MSALLAVFALPAFLGSGLLAALSSPGAPPSLPRRLTRLAQAWSAGFVAIGLALFACAWFGLALPGLVQLGLFTAAGLAAHAVARLNRSTPREEPTRLAQPSRLEWGLFTAALIAALASTFDRATLARLDPIIRGDEAAIWTAAARGLDAAGGYTDEYAHAIATTITHPDYPALNPLWQRFVFDLEAGPEPFSGRLPMQAAAAALLLLVAGSLAERTRPALAAAGTLAMAGLHGAPSLDLVQTAYSDGLVALGLALATVSWLEWQERHRTVSLVLVSTGLALAVFAKNEGLMHAATFLAGALVAGLVAHLLKRDRSQATEQPGPHRLAPALLLLAFVPALLTRLVSARFGLESDMTGSANAAGAPIWQTIPGQLAERGPLVVDYLVRHLLLAPSSGGLIFMALLLALIARPKQLFTGKLAAPALMVLLSSLGYTLIFIGSVHHLGRGPGAELWHLDTALVRVFAQLVPAALLVTTLSLQARGYGAVASRYLNQTSSSTSG